MTPRAVNGVSMRNYFDVDAKATYNDVLPRKSTIEPMRSSPLPIGVPVGEPVLIYIETVSRPFTYRYMALDLTSV